MRIIQVIHGYPMRYNAGSEVYTQGLAQALAERHDVHVFTRQENAFLPEYALQEYNDPSSPGIKLHVINMARARDGRKANKRRGHRRQAGAARPGRAASEDRGNEERSSGAFVLRAGAGRPVPQAAVAVTVEAEAEPTPQTAAKAPVTSPEEDKLRVQEDLGMDSQDSINGTFTRLEIRPFEVAVDGNNQGRTFGNYLKTRCRPQSIIPAKLVQVKTGFWNPVAWTVSQPKYRIRLFRLCFSTSGRRPVLPEPDRNPLLLWTGSIGRYEAFVA